MISDGAVVKAVEFISTAQGSSSNTGFEEFEKALFYFIQREDGKLSFVLVHDKPSE